MIFCVVVVRLKFFSLYHYLCSYINCTLILSLLPFLLAALLPPCSPSIVSSLLLDSALALQGRGRSGGVGGGRDDDKGEDVECVPRRPRHAGG
jgi:hypothetical protein